MVDEEYHRQWRLKHHTREWKDKRNIELKKKRKLDRQEKICIECKRNYVPLELGNNACYCNGCRDFHAVLSQILHYERRRFFGRDVGGETKIFKHAFYTPITCQVCGTDFVRENARRKFCSIECQTIAAMRTRQKAETTRDDITHCARGYIHKATHVGIPINLTVEEIKEMFHKPCHYSSRIGVPRNGIDRVDNNNGYVKGNVVPCHKEINFAKRHFSQETFARIIIDCYPWASSFLNGGNTCVDVPTVKDGSRIKEQ